MPHCIVEYSADLPSSTAQRLLNVVHEAVESSILFNATDVRSRTQAFENYRLGSVDKKYFIHVTIKLLAGRTNEQKQTLTKQVSEAIANLSVLDTLISCECIDIDTASYQRLLV